MSSIYFGGSRSLFAQSSAVTRAVHLIALRAGHSVHVGCQRGADQAVIHSMLAFPSSLVVFAVAPSLPLAPAHVQHAFRRSASVRLGAGGNVPIKARYLLRSVSAFQGCSFAVFFSPGAGSLAVARECVKSGLPVFAFSEQQPAAIPSSAGQWQPAQLSGLACWQWSSAQLSLF